MSAISELQRFESDLNRTILWCSSRVDRSKPRECLRSERLRPRALDKTDGDVLESAWIAEVVEARNALLSETPAPTERAGTARGRLLASAYEYTNHNGLTCDETHGYFDIYDNPPWDTWIGEVHCLEGNNPETEWGSSWPPTLGSYLSEQPPARRILVSWVPREFEAAVCRAIEVECIGMLSWSDAPRKDPYTAPRFEEVLPKWLLDYRLE